jgi:hypothetical protein
LDLLGRNAKTRWGEPAGLERYGHVAVTDSMEAVSWTRNLALFWKMPANHEKHWEIHKSGAGLRASKYRGLAGLLLILGIPTQKYRMS